jgi:F420-dependent methylenetetrahydromethanopterin dehydrogenase
MAEQRMRYWLTDVAIPTGFTEDARAVLAELGRLKVIDAALGPVVEQLAEMDDEDLADICDATSRAFVEALVAMTKASAVVIRADSS